MPGDIGLVAALLTRVFGFVVDKDGYAALTRERQLKFLMRAINDATEEGDWATVDALFAEYRLLKQQTGS